MNQAAWLNRLDRLTDGPWLHSRWLRGLLFLLCLLLGLAWAFPGQELAGMAASTLQQQIGRPVQLAPLHLQLPLTLATDQAQIDSQGPLGVVQLSQVRIAPAWSQLLRGKVAVAVQGQFGNGTVTAMLRPDGTVDAAIRNLSVSTPVPLMSSLKLTVRLDSAHLDARFLARGQDEIHQLNLSVSSLQLAGLGSLGAEQDALDLGPLTLTGTPDQGRLRLALTGNSAAMPLQGEGFVALRKPLQASPLSLRLTGRPGAGVGEKMRGLLAMGARPQPDGQLEWRLVGSLGLPQLR